MTLLQIQTQAELDAAARALADAWEQSFAPAPKFDGKKKNALRDVVLRLAGYPNGYQQWKERCIANANPSEVGTTTSTMTQAEQHKWNARVKALPSTLLVIADPYSLSDKLLVGAPHPDDDTRIGYLYLQMSDAENPEHDLWPGSMMITQVPLWMALTTRYVASAVTIEMPDIGEYGVPSFATDDGAIAFVENLGIKLPANGHIDVTPHDRGDDGSAQIFITLTAIDG